ncbi:unnamed protein product, partial [marine sediment metagenome]
TYYPIRAAAKHAGVSERTVRTWLTGGIQLDGELIRLKSVRMDERLCIDERELDIFIALRRRNLERRERRHEKFSRED